MTPPSSEVVTLVIGELRWLNTPLRSEPHALAALHSIARSPSTCRINDEASRTSDSANDST